MKILNKAVGSIAKKVFTGKIRDAAEGKLGEGPKRFYWVLVGQKRILSLLCGLMAAVLAYAGVMGGSEVLAVLSGVGLAVGVLDADWRSQKPAWLESQRWWRLLADNSAILTSLGATVATGLTMCDDSTSAMLAKVHLTCAQGTWIMGALSVCAGFLGLKDAALKAEPPVRPADI